MSLERLFYSLKSSELRTAAFYSQVAIDTDVRAPRLAALFSEMASEEKVHARQIELLQDIFLSATENFIAAAGAQELADGFLAKLVKSEQDFKATIHELGERDIVAMAMALETDLVEVHRTYFFRVEDEQLKKLFASLNLADEAHMKRLQEYAAAL
jgi:rubrerythrin